MYNAFFAILAPFLRSVIAFEMNFCGFFLGTDASTTAVATMAMKTKAKSATFMLLAVWRCLPLYLSMLQLWNVTAIACRAGGRGAGLGGMGQRTGKVSHKSAFTPLPNAMASSRTYSSFFPPYKGRSIGKTWRKISFRMAGS